MNDPRISPIIPTSSQAVKIIQQEMQEEIAQLIESDGDLDQYFEVSLFNPLLQAQRFRGITELKTLSEEKPKTERPEEKKILEVESAEESASRFQKNNEELNARTLLILRSRLSPKDSPDDIIEKVLETYSDAALADEALEFLIQTADPEIVDKVRIARERFRASREREIKSGRNMGAQAREFSKEGLGSPTSLRDLYRDVTKNPREPIKLFDELTDKFPYEKLKSVLMFLLHSLGSDLRSKGPSIPRGELKRLIDETRSIQGILGVFRFFQSRMRLIERQFSSYGLSFPTKITFQTIAKLFIKILAERYINPDRIIETAKTLGLSEETAAQIIIYTQMRDALKQIAPRYYRNLQHRDELIKSFIGALDKLEDELEEEEQEEKNKEKKKREER